MSFIWDPPPETRESWERNQRDYDDQLAKQERAERREEQSDGGSAARRTGRRKAAGATTPAAAANGRAATSTQPHTQDTLDFTARKRSK